MLARPDPQVLWTYYGFAFELWLPSDVARAVQRSPDTWVLRRARRTDLAIHIELESDDSTLWLATACNELVSVEWRMRTRPGDASLASVDASLDEASDLLSKIADETRELREILKHWEPARRVPMLADGVTGFSFLRHLRMDANDADYLHGEIAPVRRLPVFDDIPIESATTCQPLRARKGTRDGLPAELLAIAPREHQHLVRLRDRDSSIGKALRALPREARVTRWARSEQSYECKYTFEDESTVAMYAPRGGRESALTTVQAAQRKLDWIASLWRAVLSASDERERALGAIPESERSHWQKRAYKEIGYLRSWAEVEAFGGCDNRRVSAGATLPEDPLLRLPYPPFPLFFARASS